MNNRIEGVPIGTRIKRIGAMEAGDYYIGTNGKVRHSMSNSLSANFVILEVANAYNVMDISTVTIPEGYIPDGKTPEKYYRPLTEGQHYITCKDRFVSVASKQDELAGWERICVRRSTTRVLIRAEQVYTIGQLITEEVALSYVTNAPSLYRIEERTV